LYNLSDETTHIWLSSDSKTLFLVDAGSQPLVNGLNSYNDVKQINIFITHFHYDHIQALAGLISKSYEEKDKRTVTVYIQVGVAFEFAGWLLENYASLYANEWKFKLEIIPDQDVHKLSDTISFQAIQHNQFPIKTAKHFITSTTWLIFEKTRCAKIFTGDINTPGPLTLPSAKETITNYFTQLYGTIDISKSDKQCAHLFWDFGHFSVDGDKNYVDDLKAIKTEDKLKQSFKVNYYNEHTKTSDSYNSYIITLTNALTETAVFPSVPLPGNKKKKKRFLKK